MKIFKILAFAKLACLGLIIWSAWACKYERSLLSTAAKINSASSLALGIFALESNLMALSSQSLIAGIFGNKFALIILELFD